MQIGFRSSIFWGNSSNDWHQLPDKGDGAERLNNINLLKMGKYYSFQDASAKENLLELYFLDLWVFKPDCSYEAAFIISRRNCNENKTLFRDFWLKKSGFGFLFTKSCKNIKTKKNWKIVCYKVAGPSPNLTLNWHKNYH